MIKAIIEGVGRLIWAIVAGAGRFAWGIVRPSLIVAGVVLLIGAVVALTSDFTRWQTGQEGPLFNTLGDTIRATAPATLDAVGTLVAERIHPLAWDPIAVAIMSLPAWSVLVVLALAIGVAVRERKQVDIFIN